MNEFRLEIKLEISLRVTNFPQNHFFVPVSSTCGYSCLKRIKDKKFQETKSFKVMYLFLISNFDFLMSAVFYGLLVFLEGF